MGILEFIHNLVETFDRYFNNVVSHLNFLLDINFFVFKSNILLLVTFHSLSCDTGNCIC